MNDQKEPETTSARFVFRNIWTGLKSYLTDWRNLLGHALLGVGFVVIAVWAPIHIWLKLVIIAVLITFNILRMRNKNKKSIAEEGNNE